MIIFLNFTNNGNNCDYSVVGVIRNMFKKLSEKLAKESYGGNKYLQNDYGVTPYGILCEYLLWILILILLIAQLLRVILVICI